MRTVVLFPTAGEAEAFRRRCPGVAYRITGVGPAAAAAATARAIVDERPDLLLLAGIAGVYPASEVAVGEVVAVAEERVEGLPERYADVYRPTFAVPGLRTAVSNSVARSGAAPAGAEVENMEGAAFFAVAAALGVPAAEVRAVSNRVGEPFGVWPMPARRWHGSWRCSSAKSDPSLRRIDFPFADPPGVSERGDKLEIQTDRLMKTSTKWMIGIAAALVLFFLLIFYSSEIYVWAMGKITTFVIWAVIFLAGFLIGRFGGRSRSEKAVTKKRLSADDDD